MQEIEKIKVFAIDDDNIDLETLRRSMQQFDDIELFCFNELREAITCFREENGDVFLLDYYMPSHNGLECIKILHAELGTNVPVIVATGRDDAKVHKDVIASGAQDCISKREMGGDGLYRSIRNARERQKLQQQLRLTARTDYVTGLPNRCAMMEEINLRLRSRRRFNLLVMDLDDFKLINDGYGHDMGDELLRRFARVLSESIRPCDHLSRFGGDEYVLILDGEMGDQELSDFLAPILSRLKEGFEIDGALLYTSASIGIVSSEGFLGSSTMLFRDADTAMFVAKSSGKSTYARFDQSMKSASLERLELECGLRQAIGNNELELHYQPILCLRTNRVLGCEALLRWRRANGYVPTEKLIQISEQVGLIHEIGNWVFKTAIIKASEWHRIMPNLRIHVNVSPTQLLREEFIRLVRETVSEVGMSVNNVVIEITESKELEDRSNAFTQLKNLKRLGFRISLDDFGTGYSSLSQLHRLPIDEVKIDRAFIAGLDDASTSESTEYCDTFVSAIQSLANSIGLDVIAEGIETVKQIEILSKSGYTMGQGYLFAKPMPPDSMESYLLDAQQKQIALEIAGGTSSANPVHAISAAVGS